MDGDIDESVAVKQLRAAGTNQSKQVPAIFKLGEWYLRKAKATLNSVDFTKANALYNAALVRSRCVDHEIGEDEILQKISSKLIAHFCTHLPMIMKMSVQTRFAMKLNVIRILSPTKDG